MMSVLLILLGVSVLYPGTGALSLNKPVLQGPSIVMEKSYRIFYCHIPEIPENLSLTYTLKTKKHLDWEHRGEYSALSGQQATFNIFITEDVDLMCEASGHNDTDIETTQSDILHLKFFSPVTGATIISHPSSRDLWEEQTLTLKCNVTQGTDVSYEWLRDESPVQMSYDRTHDTLIIGRLSVRDAGLYNCIASNQINNTVYDSHSDGVSVNVREYLSGAKISFEVEKEAGNFIAIVKCQSERGSGPITFTLLNSTEVIEETNSSWSNASFTVPIELNRHMGGVRCMAKNQGNMVQTDTISLTVESVAGAVTMTQFKHVGRDFQVGSVELRCRVERGTFPFYRWFLNGTRLLGEGGFYAVYWSDNSILSLSVCPDSAGFYHCEATDRFDNSTTVRSQKMLINKEVLHKISSLVVAVVFSCFIVLVIAVTVCCIYGVVLRRRYQRKHPLIKQRRGLEIKAKQEEDYDEDDADLEVVGYEEEVVHADKMTDSEDEETSIDETILYETAASK